MAMDFSLPADNIASCSQLLPAFFVQQHLLSLFGNFHIHKRLETRIHFLSCVYLRCSHEWLQQTWICKVVRILPMKTVQTDIMVFLVVLF